MSLPNQLILFNNHFSMHRRNYPFSTRMAIAADTGYDGYEFHPMEPGDDKSWDDATAAFRASGLKRAGMYVVSKGINDDEFGSVIWPRTGFGNGFPRVSAPGISEVTSFAVDVEMMCRYNPPSSVPAYPFPLESKARLVTRRWDSRPLFMGSHTFVHGFI